jgi:hypothetical protein
MSSREPHSLEFVVHTISDPNAKKPDGNTIIASKIADWINHPDNKIDLCAVPVGNAFANTKPAPFYRTLGLSLFSHNLSLKTSTLSKKY